MIHRILRSLVILAFILNVEVASFFMTRNAKLVYDSSRLSSQLRMDDATPEEVTVPQKAKEVVNQQAIMSESVMNQRLIEMGSEPIDFDLLKKTIAEWSRPLPKKYCLQPLILVGPSGVGKGRLVRALLKDYKRFFSKIVTHTTRG